MNRVASPDKKQTKIFFSLESNEQQPTDNTKDESEFMVQVDNSTEIKFEPAYENNFSIEPPTAAEDSSEKADSIPVSESTEISDFQLNSEKLERHHRGLVVSTTRNQYHADLLDQEIVEYYIRKNDLKTLEPDSSGMAQDLEEKFKQLLNDFGVAMAEDRSVQISYDTQIEQLDVEVLNSGRERNQSLEVLVERLQSVGLTLQSSRNGQQMSEKFLNRILKKLKVVKSELSTKRTDCIKLQNFVRQLEQDAKNLKDLGDGLHLLDFEQLLAETTVLSEKNEERSNDLSRLQLLCDADTQKLAHFREKEESMQYQDDKNNDELFGLYQEQHELREKLTGLKIKKNDLRKECQKLTEKTGILDNLSLLNDYDRTMNEIKKLQSELFELSMGNQTSDDNIHKIAVQIIENLNI